MRLWQGIALSADPNYKVLGSAYPWIARRLLSDDSAELQETLRALLYKGSAFQFGRLESLLRQAVKSPPRQPPASAARPGAQVSPGARMAFHGHPATSLYIHTYAYICAYLYIQPGVCVDLMMV